MDGEREGGELELNPTLEIKITIGWRLRGEPQRTMSVTAADPELLRFVTSLAGSTDDEASVSLSPRLTRLLREHHLLVLPDEVPLHPAFAATLPDMLPDLFPSVARASTSDEGDLELNPDCHLQVDGASPAALAGRLEPNESFPSPPLVWVDDVATGILAPFGLESATGALARRLIERSLEPAGVTGAARAVLRAAGILVAPGHRTARIAEGERWASQLHDDYLRQGYAVIRQLLNPLQVALMRSYFRLVEAEELVPDPQLPLRMAKHREPLCEHLHQQTVSFVGRILHEPVKATYSFFGMYRPGAVLPRHRDRPQCRWNISLILDGDPEPTPLDGWPLYIESGQGADAVRLGLGDAVLYSGTDTTHWRDAQGPAKTSGVFFHYVPPSFAGSLD